jgi:hypothetical protein
MRLVLFMTLMVVTAGSHAQPTTAPAPPLKTPAAVRNADEASEKSKLEAAAEKTKKRMTPRPRANESWPTRKSLGQRRTGRRSWEASARAVSRAVPSDRELRGRCVERRFPGS